ncbi:bifunctional diaminohydroxyphosphoribosylaminopyrimidine deaminase/5-amino-6-(5-phosphoribosylamino)uracil reductase RibD [Roseospira visakhapatnamensis]|uniref:Riboflavin biosynthesis protein RibD n=1 Tax=Roseospira visakhapatnamensis TaxID=390880 RepID=A0A7W6W8W0_9PROT|nr:bifunctional diaminohydroxyphosphoribosylaminopyrimidine deaminase/5-amino-6-(5-phosphoribosylamino)uracil reductase RibD [Roseospira visakhapatnamensis]MBB4264831.1 diaminohydroxyphosphoribosylaminopyrimidine deaminase/5-amino-6-(5-phosphoribosylamino)uracil reductase [Roseospira visakhapatnamensis]
MAAALALARRGLGRVWPNPAVGCVLVQADAEGDEVVGRGWTQPGGRPHAEVEALVRAGERARGATAYVTLEPCSHHGQTPPCADALVTAGVARVVVALTDPDPRVAGRGLARLRAAGVRVDEGLRSEEARLVTAGFLSRVTAGRSLVTVKAATTLDGRIATAAGESRWITGPRARALGHRLRATHDAIAVGIGTALVDDPMLDCRLPGLEDRSPVRVVFDGALRLPIGSRLAASADRRPVWLLCRAADLETAEGRARRDRLEGRGVRVLPVPADTAGRVDPRAALQALGDAGLTRLLVEGGGRLIGALLAADVVDHLAWMQAPRVLGDGARPGVAGFGVDRLADCANFAPLDWMPIGPDMVLWARRVGD